MIYSYETSTRTNNLNLNLWSRPPWSHPNLYWWQWWSLWPRFLWDLRSSGTERHFGHLSLFWRVRRNTLPRAEPGGKGRMFAKLLRWARRTYPKIRHRQVWQEATSPGWGGRGDDGGRSIWGTVHLSHGGPLLHPDPGQVQVKFREKCSCWSQA